MENTYKANPIADHALVEPRKTEMLFSYCDQRMPKPPAFDTNIEENRLRLILDSNKKWVNGTVLHYYFFDQDTDGEFVLLRDGAREFRPWTTSDEEKDVVRAAFQTWKDVGIGLQFVEVSSRSEAEIRIGFMRGDGAWSYVGRDILDQGQGERTMNFGWDLTRATGEIDTAIHEIGHTLGFPHEHQNPNSGIVWDEERVYEALALPPNGWSREQTFHNIIRKLNRNEVVGSNWDPNSVMHYPFEAGLIKRPEVYLTQDLVPAGGLSQHDREVVRRFYPGSEALAFTPLRAFQSVPISARSGEQVNFIIEPDASREYEIAAFGSADLVAVLFEEIDGTFRYLAGDDDGGEERNARIKAKLWKGRRYALRVRVYYTGENAGTAVLMW